MFSSRLHEANKHITHFSLFLGGKNSVFIVRYTGSRMPQANFQGLYLIGNVVRVIELLNLKENKEIIRI